MGNIKNLEEIEIKIKEIVDSQKTYVNKNRNISVAIIKKDACFCCLGDLVSIRSVCDGDPPETFIGIYIGSIPFFGLKNPVFYIPKLKKLVAGFESWWSPISKEDYKLTCEVAKDKYKITDDGIKKQIERMMEMMK